MVNEQRENEAKNESMQSQRHHKAFTEYRIRMPVKRMDKFSSSVWKAITVERSTNL